MRARAAVAGLLLWSGSVGAAALPEAAPERHLGVKACSGAPCHGRGAANGAVVLQDEHSTWMRRDAHSRAYLSLVDERGKRIARKLGIAEPERDKRCLDCHADNVPDDPRSRGEQFAIEDGVGCEACHGGSGGRSADPSDGWIRSHFAEQLDHARNVERGMYPTDAPVARATLCLSCHLGTRDKFVDHRMMAAGHPRMSFELDTFTQVQPAHFRVDDDYRERGKAVPSSAALWAVGQAVQVRSFLEELAEPKHGPHGIWPEFVFFDCNACHHPMRDARWAPRATAGLAAGPGMPRLNDSSLLMLRAVLAAVNPAAAARLRQQTLAIHAATLQGTTELVAASRQLRAAVDEAITSLASWSPTPETVRAAASNLIAEALAGEYRDYAAAEQVTMAVQSLSSALDELGALDQPRLDRINRTIETLLAATRDGEAFDPASLAPSLRELQAELR